jgi:hypothetical protein
MNGYETLFPDYNKSIVNISSAILTYFGARTNHEPLVSLSEYLKKGGYQKIVLLVLDGFGALNQESCLDKDAFLLKNRLDTVSSVFPPTTAAALTSIEHEQFPNEHCRLGWAMYFSDIKKSVEVFSGKTYGKRFRFRSYHKVNRELPFRVKTLAERIAETGIEVNTVSPFSGGQDRQYTVHGVSDRIASLCGKPKKRFVYAYINEPDTTFHKSGINSDAGKKVARELDEAVRTLAERLPKDTAIIVTCDHGHADIKEIKPLQNIKGLTVCLSAVPDLEPLEISFRVKKEKEEEFLRLMGEYAPSYRLFTKQEVLDKKLYGTGKNHPRMEEFVGDYLAVCIGDTAIWHNRSFLKFKSVHGGLHACTMICPVVVSQIV